MNLILRVMSFSSLDETCDWFVLSSTGGIASNFLSLLGTYIRLDCNETMRMVYYNEQSGAFLFQTETHKGNWVVSTYND